MYAPPNAALDADGDGMTNLAEYLAGTDPREVHQFNHRFHPAFAAHFGDASREHFPRSSAHTCASLLLSGSRRVTGRCLEKISCNIHSRIPLYWSESAWSSAWQALRGRSHVSKINIVQPERRGCLRPNSVGQAPRRPPCSPGACLSAICILRRPAMRVPQMPQLSSCSCSENSHDVLISNGFEERSRNGFSAWGWCASGCREGTVGGAVCPLSRGPLARCGASFRSGRPL